MVPDQFVNLTWVLPAGQHPAARMIRSAYLRVCSRPGITWPSRPRIQDASTSSSMSISTGSLRTSPWRKPGGLGRWAVVWQAR